MKRLKFSRDLAMVYANQASNLHALKRNEEAEIAAQKRSTCMSKGSQRHE